MIRYKVYQPHSFSDTPPAPQLAEVPILKVRSDNTAVVERTWATGHRAHVPLAGLYETPRAAWDAYVAQKEDALNRAMRQLASAQDDLDRAMRARAEAMSS